MIVSMTKTLPNYFHHTSAVLLDVSVALALVVALVVAVAVAVDDRRLKRQNQSNGFHQ